MTKQTTIVVTGALRVNIVLMYFLSHCLSGVKGFFRYNQNTGSDQSAHIAISRVWIHFVYFNLFITQFVITRFWI